MQVPGSVRELVSKTKVENKSLTHKLRHYCQLMVSGGERGSYLLGCRPCLVVHTHSGRINRTQQVKKTTTKPERIQERWHTLNPSSQEAERGPDQLNLEGGMAEGVGEEALWGKRVQGGYDQDSVYT